MALLKPIYKTKNRDEWLEKLGSQGIPVAPVQNVDDFMNYEQVIANGMIQTVKEPGKGLVKEMGIPVDVTGCPGKIKGPSPQPGQHTREILKELGYPAQEIKRLRQGHVIKLAPRRK